MKLKKNDILELVKGGKPGILSKLQELQKQLAEIKLKKQGTSKIVRRSIARLMTKLKEIEK